MDLDIVLLSQRKTNTLWYYLYVKSEKKKRWYKWTYLQNRNKVTDVENKPMVIRGLEG